MSAIKLLAAPSCGSNHEITQPSPSKLLGFGDCVEVISGFFFPGFTL